MAEERKCYTLSFKKKVLDKLEENGNNIAQTARDFNIHRKNVQRWIVQKELIIKACKNRMVIVLLTLHRLTFVYIHWETSVAPVLQISLI